MKIFFASALILVGSCSTVRHSKKIENLKESISFHQEEDVQRFLNTITEEELKIHLEEISSEKYLGRKTGETGHNEVCDYIRDYYESIDIEAPATHPDYFQTVPKEVFPEGFKDSQNVIAYIEGSEFPDEYIYMAAHSDHEGVIDGQIYYGADDNGSGTAAVMEMADAYTQAVEQGFRPKRSIVFLHVTAEEIGLHGSRYYTENPIFPMDQTVSMLNVDMIGRVDERHENNEDYIYIIGADRVSTELHYITQEANRQFVNLELDYKYNDDNDINRYFYRSDQYNFALKGIPVIFFFNGEHEDYTEPTDTADKINYPLLAKRTKLIFSISWYLANSPQKLNPEVI